MIATAAPRMNLLTMTETERGALYQQYLPLAAKLTNQFSRYYGLPYDDLHDEAQGLLGMSIASWERYNPAAAGVTTWLHRWIYLGLLTYCTRGHHTRSTIPFSVLEMDDNAFDPPAKTSRLDRVMRDLSDEAKDVLYLILHAPAEIADDLSIKTSTRARQSIQKYLLTTLAWQPARVERVWIEIQEAL